MAEVCLSLGSLAALQPVPPFKVKHLLLLIHTPQPFLPLKKIALVPPPFRVPLNHSTRMARPEGTSGDTRCPPNLLWVWFLTPSLSSATHSRTQGFTRMTSPCSPRRKTSSWLTLRARSCPCCRRPRRCTNIRPTPLRPAHLPTTVILWRLPLLRSRDTHGLRPTPHIPRPLHNHHSPIRTLVHRIPSQHRYPHILRPLVVRGHTRP